MTQCNYAGVFFLFSGQAAKDSDVRRGPSNVQTYTVGCFTQAHPPGLPHRLAAERRSGSRLRT